MMGLCDVNIWIFRYDTDDLLDFVVTEEVKTWTQGIVRAQWNESNWYVTEFVL